MKDITCIQVRERMTDYIDGALEPQDQAAFLAHIRQCPACRQEAEQLSALVGSLREIPQVPVPDSFDVRLTQALKEEMTVVSLSAKADKNSNNPKKRRWKAMSAAAAVLLVGLLSITMFEDGLGAGINDFFCNEELPSGEENDVNKDENKTESAMDFDSYEEKTAGADSENAALPAEEEEALSQNEPVKSASSGNQRLNGENSDVSSDYSEKKDEKALRAKFSLMTKKEAFSDADGMEEDFGDASESESEYLMDSAPALCAGMGGDGMEEAAISSESALSRGGSAYPDMQRYDTESRRFMDSCAEAIEEKNSALFTDIIAKVGINGYTTDTAVSVLKWYQDYLGEGKLKVQFLKNDSQKTERVYLIEGNKNSTRFTVSGTAAGIRVQNTILNHGVWLAQNAPGEGYVLNDVIVGNRGTEVHFCFTLDATNADTGNEGDTSLDLPAEKEIVWKKTE